MEQNKNYFQNPTEMLVILAPDTTAFQEVSNSNSHATALWPISVERLLLILQSMALKLIFSSQFWL